MSMDAAAIGVIISGAGLIAFVLWYFFGKRKKVSASLGEAGVQEIDVRVYRDETSSCSEQIVFGDFGIARNLPPFKTTPIEFTPEKTGEFTFTCGMNMLRGKLVVEAD